MARRSSEGAAPAAGRGAGPPLEEVVAALEEDIIFGRLKPHERLVEDAVMERLGAKRHVVRQAFANLEKLGIVVREPNKGSRVRDFSPTEVEHIYDVRALLQGHAARTIPLPAPPALVSALEGIHREHSRAVEGGDLRAVYRLNNAFHDTLFSACGNAYLVETIHQYAWLAHAIRSYRIGDPALLAQARAEHGEMIDALRIGDRDRLVQLCVDHIEPSKRAYLGVEARAASAPAP
jgi:DNA-binding GntR family transcriptional regulator